MDALTLTPRPIRSLEPLDDTSDELQMIPSDGHYIWLNSSYELEHGLDVVELNAEVDHPLTAV